MLLRLLRLLLPGLVLSDLCLCSSVRLHLSYDQLYIGKVYTNIVMASYDSENCQKLELEGFSRNDLRMNNSMVPKRQTNTTNQNHSFELVTQDWLNLYFRIIARDDSNILCSDSHTGRVYYHFNESQHVNYVIPNGNVCFPIPETNICHRPVLVWDHSCSCGPYNDAYYSECANLCRTNYTTEAMNNSVCFNNLSSEMNNTLFHFTCSQDLCAAHDCLVNFIVSSYRIIIEGTVITTQTTMRMTEMATSMMTGGTVAVYYHTYNNVLYVIFFIVQYLLLC